MSTIDIRDIAANDMTFRCRVAGDTGEPVVLLHGFPETSHMWVDLMARLVAAGYRCIAPDQRGYSPGARPQEVDAYSYRDLSADVFALVDAMGFERFHLIGHDWGSLVGWAMLGLDGRRRIASYTSLSIPHAVAMARDTYENPAGDLYRGILTFLLTEGGPEAAFVADNGKALRDVYTHSTPEEVDEYVSVLSQPGAMRGAANWYRASHGHKLALEPGSPFGDVTTPTMLIVGRNDPYVLRGALEGAAPMMKGEYRVAELDAGHWLAQEAPDRVASEVLDFLRAHKLA